MMTIDEKCCCNCLHCARWNTSRGVECHCDIDDKYLGYLTVMNTELNCDDWVKETEWDIQIEHDKQIYGKAVEDLLEVANDMAIEVDTGTYIMKAVGIGLLEQIAEQLKVGGTDE